MNRELPVTHIEPQAGWVPLRLGDLLPYRRLLGILAWWRRR